jgi:hypothetical protein
MSRGASHPVGKAAELLTSEIDWRSRLSLLGPPILIVQLSHIFQPASFKPFYQFLIGQLSPIGIPA